MQEERSDMSLYEKNELEKIEEKILVKYRKYSKKTERVKKTNQMVIVCMSIIKGFLLLGFITQILLGKQGAGFIGIPAVLLGLGLIADWVLYIRDHSSVILKNVILYGFLLVYAILNFMNGSQFVILYIIPPLFCCMLYYHKQFNTSIVIIATAILVIRAIKDIIIVGNFNQSEFMMIVIAVMAMLFFQWSTRVLKQFDHDAIHTMRDEQKRQSAMMKDILGVADTTRGKVEETSERMMSLKDSTSHVNQSLHEIAQGILSTAESIQEQSEMTGEIQKAVSVAKENTIEVVKAAQNSSEQMSNNSKRMEILRNQSEDIEDKKILKREALRLELSIQSGIKSFGENKEIIVFMHYPPICKSNLIKNERNDFINIMKKYNVKKCFYGHLHSTSIRDAVEGEYFEIDFKLVSADGLDFKLYKIK